ncbi:hypothetical protein T265_03978 [Opisthorchis viverrini]|uniref:Uncharacterized protein n=1 Tax=Opisthorchis viverrini TaxID=6198 RepID=A0A075A1H5_OPIVI|nr:hypothetical protein T265_03978 [Opisthorchis viverrini]KER29410.1 hypothetical protein T265_03978 [Opisthorchis viverrini]
MPTEGSTRADIMPWYPSLDKKGREAEVGFEPRTFQSVNSSHLAPYLSSEVPVMTINILLSADSKPSAEGSVRAATKTSFSCSILSMPN